jgi:hypothetical protein
MELENIKNHEERCAFDQSKPIGREAKGKPLEVKPIGSEAEGKPLEASRITSIIRNPLFQTETIERW